jgi:hypothetical protein
MKKGKKKWTMEVVDALLGVAWVPPPVRRTGNSQRPRRAK